MHIYSSNNADLRLLPMFTSSDFWESIWRKENIKAKINDEKVTRMMNIVQVFNHYLLFKLLFLLSFIYFAIACQEFVSNIEILMQPKFDDSEIQKFSSLKSALFQSIIFDDMDESLSIGTAIEPEKSTKAEEVNVPTMESAYKVSEKALEEDYSQFLV